MHSNIMLPIVVWSDKILISIYSTYEIPKLSTALPVDFVYKKKCGSHLCIQDWNLEVVVPSATVTEGRFESSVTYLFVAFALKC